jgi:hypothetical protein
MPSSCKQSNINSGKQKDNSNEEVINSVHRTEGIVGIFEILIPGI